MIAQSFRYWLANLISGGELMRAQYMEKSIHGSAEFAMAQAREATAKAYQLQCDLNILRIDNTNGWHNSERFEAALRTIAAMPTPKANATVRRMAAVAREALK